MRYVTCCAVWMVAMTAIGSASAQEILSGDLMRVNGPFSGEQRQSVEAYLDHWGKQLIGAQDVTQIAEARRKLIDPLTQAGISEPFKTQYSALAVPKISEGVTSKNFMVRLNTLIIIGNLSGGAGVEQMSMGLRDENAAVRYWAAKAIAESLGTANGAAVMTADQRNRIQKAIGEKLATEPSADVLEQMYDALASLNTSESRRALVDAMNSRASWFAQNGLGVGLQAERTGLRRIYRVMLEAQIEGKADPALIKNLAAVCDKYLQLISRAVEKQQLADAQQAVAQEIVEVAHPALNWAVRVFDPAARPGPELTDAFRNGTSDKYVQFRLNVLQWANVLKSGKIALTDDQLKL